MHLSPILKKVPGEHQISMLRRHPVTFIPYLLLFGLLLLVPGIVYELLSRLFPALFASTVMHTIGVLFASVYLLSIYIFFFTQFISYYLDVWIVTNQRIVDVEQFGLFSRTVSELELAHIQDVTTDMHGIFSTFFNYGDVAIKTASSNEAIVARQIPNPNRVREMLIQLADMDRRTHDNTEPPVPKV